MTDKQFERFTNIIKAINKLSEKRKNIFDNQNMIITITDSKRFYIQIFDQIVYFDRSIFDRKFSISIYTRKDE